MTRIKFEVRRNQFPAIARQLPEAADVIVNRTRGPEMEQIAKERSRVATGDMQRGWRWVVTGQGTGELVNPEAHTVFNEYGTVNMTPQPMLRPAVEIVGPKIVSDFKNMERFLR